jgi:hypothetical protein
MKVISIRNPQAALVMEGIKTVETRSFKTKIRGRIGIHASLSMNKLTPEMKPFILQACEPYGCLTVGDRPLWRFPAFAGHILGTVELVDCIPAGDWIEARRMKGGHADYEREFILGDLSTDRFAWILSDPKPFLMPIPAKGRLGFWEANLENVLTA